MSFESFSSTSASMLTPLYHALSECRNTYTAFSYTKWRHFAQLRTQKITYRNVQIWTALRCITTHTHTQYTWRNLYCVLSQKNLLLVFIEGLCSAFIPVMPWPLTKNVSCLNCLDKLRKHYRAQCAICCPKYCIQTLCLVHRACTCLFRWFSLGVITVCSVRH